MKVSILAACCMLLAIAAYAQEADPAAAAAPKITSISKITTKQHQTITIKGTGFGTHKAYTGDTAYIALWDLSKGHEWQAGYKPYGDTITLIVNKWDNTEIVLGGFAGKWGSTYKGELWTLAKGNVAEIQVWNAQTGKGPVTKKLTVSAAATTVASSRNPSVYGESVTFTAAVDASVSHDGETVIFTNGTTELGRGTLSGGSASFTTSALEAGTNSIRAVYGDDDSVSLTQTVK
jgi:Bacterial Ig-like domain (group 3)